MARLCTKKEAAIATTLKQCPIAHAAWLHAVHCTPSTRMGAISIISINSTMAALVPKNAT